LHDIIKINVDADHYLRCPVDTIARDGEGNITELEITFPEKLSSYWVYLDFKMSNGEKFKSPRLDAEGNKATYIVPPYVLVEGKLKMQVLFQNEHGKIWKSFKKPFTVRPSINAVDDIPQKEDFITEAQKLLDEIEKGGTGGGGGSITVDDKLDANSTNPVQNKVVAENIGRLFAGTNYVQSLANEAKDIANNALNTANLAGTHGNLALNKINIEIEPKLAELETQVGDIDTALDELHAYAQSLVSGGATE
jgi:hypothetical protein